jgi:hypothetical protein
VECNKSSLAGHTFVPNKAQGMLCIKPRCLALAHIHANRARIVVLEVVERKVASRTHLVRNRLARGTRSRRNNVRVTRGNAHRGQVAHLAGLVGPRSLSISGLAELGEAARAAAGDGVAGCGEVLLRGEEEEHGALLAGVGGGDVEVEDGAGGLVDFAVVGCAHGGAGRAGGDRDDQVGVLVVAVQVGWALACW